MIEKLRINIQDTEHVTNVYIVWNETSQEAVLIDPADKASIISDRIEKLGLKLKYVLLTHGHKDHTVALPDIMEKYPDVKVIVDENEREMLEGKYSDSSMVFGLKQYLDYDFSRFVFLKDGDEISFGNKKVIMYHTPGHTKGGACYYIKSDNALFSGDTLFSDCFGRCDLVTSNIYDMAKSLDRLYKMFYGTGVFVYPGHGWDGETIESGYDEVKELMYRSYGINLGGKND